MLSGNSVLVLNKHNVKDRHCFRAAITPLSGISRIGFVDILLAFRLLYMSCHNVTEIIFSALHYVFHHRHNEPPVVGTGDSELYPT